MMQGSTASSGDNNTIPCVDMRQGGKSAKSNSTAGVGALVGARVGSDVVGAVGASVVLMISVVSNAVVYNCRWGSIPSNCKSNAAGFILIFLLYSIVPQPMKLGIGTVSLWNERLLFNQ